MTRYTIEARDHETQCDRCGFPFDVGDRVLEVGDFARVYCSRVCAAAHLELVGR